PRRSSSCKPSRRGTRNRVSVNMASLTMRNLQLDRPRRKDRRTFLGIAGVASLGALLRLDVRQAAPPDLWSEAESILRRIAAPSFPARTFDVARYGARPGGDVDSTPAFRAAIDACHAAGGGRVVVPRGRFVTGAIVLRSNV